MLGGILQEQGKYAEAIEQYEIAKQDEDFPWLSKGWKAERVAVLDLMISECKAKER